MIPGRRRSSSPLARVARSGAALATLATFAVAALACSNLSLSSSEMSPPGGGTLNDIDAGKTDSSSSGSPGSDGGAGGADAAAPPALVGNALCNYGYSSNATHACRPDDSFACAPMPDAAAPPTPSADAGEDAAAPLSACHVIASGGRTTQTCTAAGTGKNGDQCQSGDDCAPTFECVGSPGQCRHYCCGGDTSCNGVGSKSFCDVQPLAQGEANDGGDAGAAPLVPVCMPVSECTLLGTDCTAGTTCAVVKDDGTTSCVAVGGAAVGASCETTHCQAGLTCLGSGSSPRLCYQLCRVDQMPSACPSMETCTSSAQIFKNAQYGICQ